MDPVECAKTGDLEFFKTVNLAVLRNTVTADVYGHSLLMKAATFGHVECCEVMLKRCPELLDKRNNFGATALHQAASNGKVNCVRFLLDYMSKLEILDVYDIGIENRLDGLTAVSKNSNTALHVAVQNDQLECAKILIEADSSNTLLRMADVKGDTAMHIAVTKQNLAIVKLLCQFDSNVCYSANNAGYTPLGIAVQKARAADDPRTVEIRRALLEKYPDECMMRSGVNNWTILHNAASQGDLGTVEDIIRFCPACLDMVDNEGRNFLHLAAKFHRVEIVQYTITIATLPAGVLNGQDNYGNTPLHLAALGGDPTMVKPLLFDSRVNKEIMNKQANIALDMIHFDYDKIKAGVYGLTSKLGEKEIKERSDFDLVVGAIIATVSFAAGITAPGGYTGDGPHKGTALLANKLSFKIFVVANTIALLLALYAVFSNFCAKRLAKQADLIYQLLVATYCSLGAIFAMVVAFIAGSYAVLSVTHKFAIFVCVLCCCFFFFASRALWRMIRQNRKTKPPLHGPENC